MVLATKKLIITIGTWVQAQQGASTMEQVGYGSGPQGGSPINLDDQNKMVESQGVTGRKGYASHESHEEPLCYSPRQNKDNKNGCNHGHTEHKSEKNYDHSLVHERHGLQNVVKVPKGTTSQGVSTEDLLYPRSGKRKRKSHKLGMYMIPKYVLP